MRGHRSRMSLTLNPGYGSPPKRGHRPATVLYDSSPHNYRNAVTAPDPDESAL